MVLELRVRNHPGAMSHITGLFARRAFNLEAIICAPCADDAGATSRMLLLVAADARLEQVGKQLARLHDVVDVRQRPDLDRGFFERAALLPFRCDARSPVPVKRKAKLDVSASDGGGLVARRGRGGGQGGCLP